MQHLSRLVGLGENALIFCLLASTRWDYPAVNTDLERLF